MKKIFKRKKGPKREASCTEFFFILPPGNAIQILLIVIIY